MTNTDLFNLVAPIAITGKADLLFEKKARKAWKKIRTLPVETWETKPPLEIERICKDDWGTVVDWALEEYNRLFQEIVGENNSNLILGYDYWGAKGYHLPGQSSKCFELAGDASGFFPWYESAEDLILAVETL